MPSAKALTSPNANEGARARATAATPWSPAPTAATRHWSTRRVKVPVETIAIAEPPPHAATRKPAALSGRPNASVARTGESVRSVSARALVAATPNNAPNRTLLPRMYASPSRTAWVPDTVRDCTSGGGMWRISVTATAGPRKVKALSRNAHAGPAVATMSAARMEPPSCPPVNWSRFRPVASARRSRGTRAGSSEVSEGLAIAYEVLETKAAPMSTAGTTRPVNVRTATTSAIDIDARWVTTITRRRSTRSEITPPNRENRRIGRKPAKLSSPTISGEPVIWYMNADAAMFWSQVPTLERRPPVQYREKSRMANTPSR